MVDKPILNDEFFEYARKLYNEMPWWKKGVLEMSMRAQNEEPRKPLDKQPSDS